MLYNTHVVKHLSINVIENMTEVCGLSLRDHVVKQWSINLIEYCQDMIEIYVLFLGRCMTLGFAHTFLSYLLLSML